MEVVLLERVEKLGQMGDVVRIKDGFARNFLLPRRKALRATKDNLRRFEEQRAQLEARNLELRKEAEGVHAKLDGKSFIAIRSASETGQLYGSVSTRDIAHILTEDGFSITRNQVILDKPIKELGLVSLRIMLHPEVFSGITLNVARSPEEAESQARGEDVRNLQDDEDELSAEEFFESEEAAAEALGDELDADEAGAGENEEPQA